MRRQEILAAAIKVFGKKGFAATCVGDVADAAKIAKGTVYLYFESKEEIYATAVHLAIAQLHEVAAERIRLVKGIRERLTVAIAVRMEFWHEQLNLYRLLLTVGREARHKRQTNEVLRSGHAYFLSILEEGAAAGEGRPLVQRPAAHQQRLQQDPERADRRLLVADLHVAPDEEVEQLAVVPQLA